MRKRWGSVLLALVMVLSVLPTAAFAEGDNPDMAVTESDNPDMAYAEGEDPDTVLAEGNGSEAVYAESSGFTIDGNGVLTKYTGTDRNVTIPAGVTSIGAFAFADNRNLRSVTIPEGVTSIGDSAFSQCFALASVTIPEGVTSIGDSAFSQCVTLASVTIPASVTSIGASAFWYCESLTSATIPGSVISIGTSAFSNCKKLTSVTIQKGVTSIVDSMFLQCNSLTTVTIPDSVTSIGESAFSDCTELNGVTIPGSVTAIGRNAFQNCGSLTGVDIPASVQEIGWRAFSGCTGLTGVTISEGIARIGDHVFLNCSSLTSVTIPASVTEIKWGVFEGCSSLTEINVSEGNLAYISENGVLFNSDKTVLLAFPGGRGGSYEIPGTVTTILAAAFSRCGLTSVTIPASVTGIGLSSPDSTVTEDIFQSCENLAKIEVSESNSKYASIDGVLFNKDKTELIVYPGGRRGNYTIPDTVTTIGSNAFWSCKGLTGLTISDGVSEISDWAFQGCDSLAVVYYGGTAEQWSQIRIVESGNDRLKKADIHYNSTGPQDRQCPEEMTYSFGNYDGAFGYPEGLEAFVDQSGKTAYKIRRERYTAIFGNTPLADALYSKADPWGGSCFGMSTTSAMFFQDGNGISVKAFNSAASIPKNLTVSDQNTSWNLTLREFIETMQVSWSDERICSNYSSSANDLGALCDAVKSFRATGMNPPVVTIYGTINGEKSGHAMLAYDLVEAEGGRSQLKVYDPNYPDDAARSITLNQSNGSWSYSVNNQYNWSETDPNGRISFVPYSDFYEVWNGRPNAAAGRTAFSQADENQRSALLFLNSGNAEIYDANGSKVAEIKDGQLQSNHRQDIFQMVPIDAAETGTSAGNTALYLPPDLYTVKNTGNSTEKFEATMVHVDQSAAVSTSGSSVTFAVNDRTEVNFARVNDAAPDTAYTVTMLSTPESGSEKLDTLTVSGQIGQGAPSIARVFGERFAENLADAVVTDCGAAVPQDQLKDGGTLDVSKIAGASGEITAALQADGTVVLSTVPASVQSVYAASYNSDGRMTGIVIGTLSGRTITFQGSVTKGGQIFLLDENRAPVCGRITIR